MASKAHQCDTNLSSRGDDVQLGCFDMILMCSVTWMTNKFDVGGVPTPWGLSGLTTTRGGSRGKVGVPRRSPASCVKGLKLVFVTTTLAQGRRTLGEAVALDDQEALGVEALLHLALQAGAAAQTELEPAPGQLAEARAGIVGLDNDARAAFDAELSAVLDERFPGGALVTPHRVWGSVAVAPAS